MGESSTDFAAPGLTENEAARRLAQDGFNELPSAKERSLFAIALEVCREPMFILLVVCGAVYLLLGDVHEALMLLGFVFVVMGITLYQERKTERALEALRDLSSPRALVIREGIERRIAGRDVVRGDIIVVKEGDRIPADARVISCLNLSVDESLLTGESLAVQKCEWDGKKTADRPGGDGLPFVYSGSLVVQGRGVAEVIYTGVKTEIGKIGKALQTVEQEDTVLQRETARLVKKLLIFGLCLCVLVVLIYGLTRNDWLKGVLAGITLAMAVLPEEFPVVLTIFLALGAWRISRNSVLTRRMPAIETLGSATVLCTDKTGTLTENRMSVAKLFAQGNSLALSPAALPEEFHQLVEFSVLASQRDPFDPMEKAVQALGKRLDNTEHVHGDWKLVQEYPLSKELLALSHVWESPWGGDFIIASKGAPEAIGDLCHFGSEQMSGLMDQVGKMADEGLRVLGVARAVLRPSRLPEQQHDFAFEFIGLLGFADPVRSGVSDALHECRRAGVRVIMITGDYPRTAQKIAREIGLVPQDKFITGAELEGMSDEELRSRIREANIFARVVPQQKLRIVEALKANGEIVAMTGDGVNDAPALKSAHIGVAMGERGTDVARESASLVLLNDDFSSIVAAIRLGRRVFDNIKKAIAYIFAIHVPIAGLSFFPVLFKWPIVLMPVHILFLELIIDPACSTIFEAEREEPGVMQRAPRNPNEPLFSRRTLFLSILQGIGVLVIVLCIYAIALAQGKGEDESRTLTFTTLIVANVLLIMTNRSWSRTIIDTLTIRNRALWWVVGGAALSITMVLYVPILRTVFRFAPLHGDDLMLCLLLGILSISWFELMKLVRAWQPGKGDSGVAGKS